MPGYPARPGTNYVTQQPVAAQPAPPKANAVAIKKNKIAAVGLIDALNAYEKKLVDEKVFEIANTYKIEFAPPALGDSKVTKGGKPNKAKVPMQQSANKSDNINPNSNSVSYDVRTFDFAAGTPIIVILDEILKNSSYITDQAAWMIDEVTQETKPQKPLGNLAWYKISVVTAPKGFDTKRRDFAYNITYIISTYGVSSMMSEYFPPGSLRGIHKSYKYWFTGQNTQVLRFQQEFNKAYLLTITNSTISTDTKARTNILSREAPSVQIQAAVGSSSSQGAEGITNSIGASAADYLYSPSDIAKTHLTIVGDPAWLQQGEVATGIRSLDFSFNPFNPDGGINFDAQEIVFNLQWNTVADYDVNGTGLANPNTTTSGEAAQIYTYKAVRVNNKFSKGKFEQELDGVLFRIPAPVAAATRNSNAERAGNVSNLNMAEFMGGGMDSAGARVSMNNLAATEAYNASNDFSGFNETGSSPNTTSILPFTAAEPDVNTAVNASDPEGQAFVPDFTPPPPKLKPSVTQDVNSAVNAADPEAQVFNNQLMAKDE
jgi:hypothetical protein